MFGFCLERQDWRLFKLLRLWNLSVCDEHFALREIPPEKQAFNARQKEEIKLVAIFDPSVKYQLIETYGFDYFHETEEGLVFELGFTSHDFLVRWLLGFGDNVKVIEPQTIVEDIKSAAENILSRYS